MLEINKKNLLEIIDRLERTECMEFNTADIETLKSWVPEILACVKIVKNIQKTKHHIAISLSRSNSESQDIIAMGVLEILNHITDDVDVD